MLDQLVPTDHTLVVRDGRTLEIKEYGNPTGHPAFFFHGLIGSHHQAAYVDAQARSMGLRIIAPNRPGVGRSDFLARTNPLGVVADVEDVAKALGLDQFSVIGISGGTPYALAVLFLLPNRVVTTTIISGMGPTRIKGGLHGMERRRRIFLETGSRAPIFARRAFSEAGDRFRADPEKFLDRLVATWSRSDRTLFRRRDVFELFLKDLHSVFTEGRGAETLAHELALYRNYGVPLVELPAHKRITLWQGLDDAIVPPSMAWSMTRVLPNRETHFVSGGHFMAIERADDIIARLKELLDEAGRSAS
jgi:pimeloyl-ACP methyl ester carboxylesterase